MSPVKYTLNSSVNVCVHVCHMGYGVWVWVYVCMYMYAAICVYVDMLHVGEGTTVPGCAYMNVHIVVCSRPLSLSATLLSQIQFPLRLFLVLHMCVHVHTELFCVCWTVWSRMLCLFLFLTSFLFTPFSQCSIVVHLGCGLPQLQDSWKSCLLLIWCGCRRQELVSLHHSG